MKNLNQVFLGLFVAGLFSIGGYNSSVVAVNASSNKANAAAVSNATIKVYCAESSRSCNITLPGGGTMSSEGNPTWESTW